MKSPWMFHCKWRECETLTILNAKSNFRFLSLAKATLLQLNVASILLPDIVDVTMNMIKSRINILGQFNKQCSMLKNCQLGFSINFKNAYITLTINLRMCCQTTQFVENRWHYEIFRIKSTAPVTANVYTNFPFRLLSFELRCNAWVTSMYEVPNNARTVYATLSSTLSPA